RLVHLGELVADAHAERELRVEVRLCRRNARVLADLERDFVSLAANIEPNAVLAGWRDRPGERRFRRLPRRVVLDARGVGLPHVPGEAIEPGLLRHLRLFRLLELLAAPLLRR